MANREHLLLQATTGIGKTVAALYPALRYALAHDKRLFVLTAKNTQQEMATAVLRLLNQESAFRSLRLRAKAKMCANDQILCHEEYCRFAKDYGLKLATTGVLARIHESHAAIEPEHVFNAAREAEVCPFEVSLELSSRVQVTVCDYNYVFDPYVSLASFAAEEDLSDVILVIDEVHNLVGRGRGYYSPELSSNAARRAAEVVGRWGEPIHLRIENLCLKLAALIDGTVADALEDGPPGERAVVWPLPEDRFWRLRPELDAAFVDYLEHQRETRSFQPEDPFVELYFNFLRFLNGLMVSDAAFSHCVEYKQGGRPAQDPLQGPQPLPGRGDPAHACHGRPLGDPVPPRVLHRPARLRGGAHGVRRDRQPVPRREPPGGDRSQRRHHLPRAAGELSSASPIVSPVSPTRCRATASPSFPATPSSPR